MAQQKVLKLAFSTRFSASRLTSSIINEHLVNLHIHRVAALRYSTDPEYDRGRSGYNKVQERSPENPRSRKVYLLGLGGCIAIVGGYFLYHSKERMGPIQATRPASRRDLLDDHKTSIGGRFKLVNQKGEIVTESDLIGHWTLLYFGYTSCPEDCPEELQKLADTVEVMDKQTAEKITPVFITVDPKRDSPAQLQAYLSEFHPRIIGLTGSVDDIRQVAREYRVFYKRVEDEGSDYLVEHSNLIYLMDPDMEFVKFFGKEYDVRNLVLGVLEEMKRHKNVSV